MLNNLISLQDVLKSLKISRSSLYRLMNEGLPHVKIGGLKFDPVAVENWILEHKATGRVNTPKPAETLIKSPAIRPEPKHRLTTEPDSKTFPVTGFITFNATFKERSKTGKQPAVILSNVTGSDGYHADELMLDARTGRPFGNFLAQNPEPGCQVKFVARQVKNNIPCYILSADIE
jgi:predicted DNA-binding transcriptional regulator AlpA